MAYVMTKRTHGIHEDSIDNVLDRLSDMREELQAIERSLERLHAPKLEQVRDGSGQKSRSAA